MDFELVLGKLLDGFERRGVRYALIGGFALGALGAPRATQDMDFLIRRDDMDALHESLSKMGYRRVHHSEDVSQYQGENAVLGCLDFIHAFRELALEMLERAEEKPIFSGKRAVRVLRAEDIIGLKVQAMANDPERRHREMADIQALARVAPDLDWSRIKTFFDLFDIPDDFASLKRGPDA